MLVKLKPRFMEAMVCLQQFTFPGGQLSLIGVRIGPRGFSAPPHSEHRSSLGLKINAFSPIHLSNGAYAPDSKRMSLGVARAVKEDLTPLRTARGSSSTVLFGFQQLMSKFQKIAQIRPAFEHMICACGEGLWCQNLVFSRLTTNFGEFQTGGYFGDLPYLLVWKRDRMIGCCDTVADTQRSPTSSTHPAIRQYQKLLPDQWKATLGGKWPV